MNRGSTTILRPLGWMATLASGALVTAVRAKAQEWLLISLVIYCGLTVLLYLVAYAYCLFTDKEALRTEEYALKRLALQLREPRRLKQK
jgi:hypothetical protein